MAPLQPRVQVVARLPPTISFSSKDKPQLEVRITLQHSEPIIVFLKGSRLWPDHLCSALTLHNSSTGQQVYLPRVETRPPRRYPVPPRITAETRTEFLGLRPNETAVVAVSFRPYDEPYDYDQMKDRDPGERWKMLLPLGMQFLKPEQEYEIGVQEVDLEVYMTGDLDKESAKQEGSDWVSAGKPL